MSGPPPPSDLADRGLPLLRLDAGTVLHRFYTHMDGGRALEPVYYDPSLLGRFNAPDGGYGVLYAARRPHGAFAETFLRRAGRRVVDPGLLARKGRVELVTLRRLNLVEFDGRRLASLGATAAVPHGDPPYGNAQAWSKALREHPDAPDGIAYTSRHDPSELCYALFESPRLPVSEVRRDVALDADWFWRIADHYDVGASP